MAGVEAIYYEIPAWVIILLVSLAVVFALLAWAALSHEETIKFSFGVGVFSIVVAFGSGVVGLGLWWMDGSLAESATQEALEAAYSVQNIDTDMLYQLSREYGREDAEVVHQEIIVEGVEDPYRTTVRFDGKQFSLWVNSLETPGKLVPFDPQSSTVNTAS